MTITIEGLNPEQARYIADTVETLSNGILLPVNGAVIVLTHDALGTLADLDECSDGHFDGNVVWIGGVNFPVRGI